MEPMEGPRSGDHVLLAALIAAARAFVDVVEGEVGAASPSREEEGAMVSSRPSRLLAFDPLIDLPPLRADPKGSRDERWMRTITLLGAIGRLNAEEGRGAKVTELREFALRAGYSGARGLKSWCSKPGHLGGLEEKADGLWLNERGHGFVLADVKRLGIELVGELTWVPNLEPDPEMDEQDLNQEQEGVQA